MMKPERIVLTEKEDKQEFISMLMNISLESPVIYNILSHFAFTYKESPQNRLRAILSDNYEEMLHMIIKTLLIQNTELQGTFEGYIANSVKSIYIKTEDYLK